MIISLSKTWRAEFFTSPLQKALLFRNLPFCSDASRVARGEAGEGAIASHWPEEYAKHPVFGTFEANFCTKNENIPPPPSGIGDDNWSKIRCDSDQKNWVLA